MDVTNHQKSDKMAIAIDNLEPIETESERRRLLISFSDDIAIDELDAARVLSGAGLFDSIADVFNGADFSTGRKLLREFEKAGLAEMHDDTGITLTPKGRREFDL